MKHQLGKILLLAACTCSAWAQNGNEPVQLKDITSGKYRQQVLEICVLCRMASTIRLPILHAR